MLTIPPLSCFDSFKIAMAKYCKFNGRARRSEFWYFKLTVAIINAIYLLIAIIIIAIINNKTDEEEIEKIKISDNIPLLVIGIVIEAIFILPNIAVSVRRLHDVGKSGYYYFLNLIPVIGTLILLYFYIVDSFPDSNEYGPSTKYIQPSNDFSRKSLLINTNIGTKELQDIP